MRRSQFCIRGHDKSIVGSYANSTCKQCLKDRTSKYPPDKMREYKRAWRHRNIKAWRQSTKNWRMKNPEAASASQRRTRLAKYGLTESDFQNLIDSQQGCCAICKTLLMIGGKGGCKIDHCHKTGIVRGILCSPCNTGIGHLKDDINILQTAIYYLERKLLSPEAELGIL